MEKEEDIFEAAAGLLPGERPAYIDAVCIGRPELRERLMALLRSHDSSGFMLDCTAISPGSVGKSARGPLEQPGQTIGRYRLLQPIGEGGFGVVWMAEQVEPVMRRVALKIIKAGMDTKEVIARFEVERQALAMMDHSNIAQILDAGATDNGRPYFVMELVNGIPITQFCDEHKYTMRQRLELFGEVCLAISHAHQKGIIHRDIKPSNILVAFKGDRPAVKIIDFGIAKATQGRLTNVTLYTPYEQFMGTPAYMSPEQASPAAEEVDTRSDIYCLGVLLYELLTGTPPFDAKSLLSAGYEAMRRMICNVEPIRPSVRLGTVHGQERTKLANARRIAPGRLPWLVKPDLDWIVMKAIEKNREHRYASAVGLVNDLQRFLADEPVSARPQSVGYRLNKFTRRNRNGIRVACSIAAIILLAMILVVWQDIERRRALESELMTSYFNSIVLAQREWQAGNLNRAEQVLDECPPLIRHWEWHYLKRLCNPERLCLPELSGLVTGVTYNRDGSRLVTTSPINTMIWDSATAQRLLIIPSEEGDITRVALSRDGSRLAIAAHRAVNVRGVGNEYEPIQRGDGTVTGDSVVKVRDVHTGKEMLAIDTPDFLIRSLDWSPDGKRIAIGGVTRYQNGGLMLWDAETGKQIWSWVNLNSNVNVVAISPDGKLIAFGTGDQRYSYPDDSVHLKVWDASTGVSIRDFRGHTGGVAAVAFSPDGKRIASCSADRNVKVWEVSTGRELLNLRGHTQEVHSVVWSADGRQLASAGEDAVVRLWNATTGENGLELRGHRQPIADISFSPDGQKIVSAGGSEVSVWELAVSEEARVFRGHSGPVIGVDFSPDGRQLVSMCESNSSWNPAQVIVRRLATGEEDFRLPCHWRGATAVSFDHGGSLLATASAEDGVQVWDPATGQLLRSLGSVSMRPEDFAIDPSGRWAVAIGKRGAVVWDLPSGKVRLQLPANSRQSVKVAVNSDGRRFAIIGFGGHSAQNSEESRIGLSDMIKIWDVNSGQEIMSLPGGGSFVAFSPDGNRIASWSRDNSIRVFDTRTRCMLFALRGHTAGVSDVAFSPDGRRLASASHDHTIRLWEMEAGREVLVLRGSDAPALSVAFSPDGTQLASGGGELGVPGEVRLWDIRPLDESPSLKK